MMAEPYWAVAQALPMRGEQKSRAEIFLGHAGYETYCPRTRRRSRGKMIVEPLFAGYIFVRVIENWWTVRWTPGVTKLLMQCEKPAKLPNEFIDDLRSNERGGFIRLPPRQHPHVRGAQVRVLTGQFRGLIGLYEGQSSREREIVLLDMLGRKVPVELAVNDAIEIAN
jgi:transcription antitermination factor NusG